MKHLSPVRDALAHHRNVDYYQLVRALINHSGWIVPAGVMLNQYDVNHSQAMIPESGDLRQLLPDTLLLYTDIEAVNESKAAKEPVPCCMAGIDGNLIFSKLNHSWIQLWINPGSKTTACTIKQSGYGIAEWYAKRMQYEKRLVQAWKIADDEGLANVLRSSEEPFAILIQENGIMFSGESSQGTGLILFTTPDCMEAAIRTHGDNILRNCEEGAVPGNFIDAGIEGVDGVIVNPFGPGPSIQYWWTQNEIDFTPVEMPTPPTKVVKPGEVGDSSARVRDEHGRKVIEEHHESGKPFVLYLRSYQDSIRYGKADQENYLIEEYIADHVPAGVNTLSVQIPTQEGKLTDVIHNRNTPAVMLEDDWAEVVQALLVRSDLIVCECLVMSVGVEQELQMLINSQRCDHTVLLLPPPACHLPTLDHHPLVKHFPHCIWVNEFYDRDLFECPSVAEMLNRVERLAQLPPAKLAAIPPDERRNLFAESGEQLEAAYRADSSQHASIELLAEQRGLGPELHDANRHYILWTKYRHLHFVLRRIASGVEEFAENLNFIISQCIDIANLLGSVRMMSERTTSGSIPIAWEMPDWAQDSLAAARELGMEPLRDNRDVRGDLGLARGLAHWAGEFAEFDPNPALRFVGASHSAGVMNDLENLDARIEADELAPFYASDPEIAENDPVLILLREIHEQVK